MLRNANEKTILLLYLSHIDPNQPTTFSAVIFHHLRYQPNTRKAFHLRGKVFRGKKVSIVNLQLTKCSHYDGKYAFSMKSNLFNSAFKRMEAERNHTGLKSIYGRYIENDT